MSRPFTPQEAKKLIDDHKAILSKLKTLSDAERNYKFKIIDACDSLIYDETVKILRDIPAEEINKSGGGLRIKPLKEAGYETIADVISVPAKNLTNINGISEETGYIIHKRASEIAEKVRSSCKIRLSLDDKNECATKLVTEIQKYRQVKPHSQWATETRQSVEGEILRDIKVLSESCGHIGWLISSADKKKKGLDAFNRLSRYYSSSYPAMVNKRASELAKIDMLTGAESWEEFSKNPTYFYTVIEEINPGVLGNDDSLYGLPEELAQQVSEEEIFPHGLNFTLRNYQEWGVKYILHQGRVLLGDEMGLGKTVQAIAAMVSLSNSGGTHFMVVCPASVLSNWCREIQKASTLSVIPVHGATRLGAFTKWKANGGVAVTTYETTAFLTLDDGFTFSMLTVDEAHYIKNPEANRTRNVTRLSRNAEKLLFMTGTAMENKVEEMVNIIHILQPDIARRISRMTYLKSAPQFREAIAPVYYRRRRADVLTELPELTEIKEWCTLSEDEATAYEDAVLSGRYSDARRVSWSCPDIKNSSKAKRLLELVEEAEEDGRKVIVFSFFLDTIAKVQTLLGERCMPPINGSVSPIRRQEIIDEFEKAAPGAVLAAQILAGGTGLNIQSASVVIFCEPQFKPSIENQAVSRAYRMGQTRNVLVYRLLCENTIDERLTELLEEKQQLFDTFADSSVAADETFEIDQKSFGDIMKEEFERINQKNKE